MIPNSRELAAEIRDLQRAFAAMPYAAASDPPRELKARVLAAAAAADASIGRRTSERTRGDQRPRVDDRRRSGWAIAATAVAAGFAVVFALDAHHLRRELTLERTVAGLLQQPNVVVSFALAGTGTAGSAYGSVALDMDGAKGALAARGLPAAPSGHVYRLWAVSGGKDVLCGQFSADPERAARAQFVVPVNAYEGAVERVFVTLEPLAETPQPTGPRVLESI